jgi:hypothetical protein
MPKISAAVCLVIIRCQACEEIATILKKAEVPKKEEAGSFMTLWSH